MYCGKNCTSCVIPADESGFVVSDNFSRTETEINLEAVKESGFSLCFEFPVFL